MCFDGRAKSAEPLMRAARAYREMGIRSEPMDAGEAADFARLVPEVDVLSRDDMALVVMALYATDNDGFAAVKVRLEAERAEEARLRARLAESRREAEEWWAAREKAKPWERLALLVMLGVVVWGIYVGWPR